METDSISVILTKVLNRNCSWYSMVSIYSSVHLSSFWKRGPVISRQCTYLKRSKPSMFSSPLQYYFSKPQSEDNVCGREKPRPSPQLLPLTICTCAVALPEFPVLQMKFCVFLKASCHLTTHLPKVPGPSQDELFCRTGWPFLCWLLHLVSSACSPASS